MKIFFAGLEGHYKVLYDCKVKNVLGSYFIYKNKNITEVKSQFKKLKDSGATILIDSGAHTFFSEEGIGHGVAVMKQSKSNLNYDGYVKEYINWIIEVKDYVDYFVELDIGELVDYKKVVEWRKQLIETGATIIPVWHNKGIPNKEKEWEKMCKEFDYVGIEGSLPDGTYISKLNVAKKYGTKVHGFAMTKEKQMLKIPFYSVDSTSWLSGGRFGITYIFTGNKMLHFGKDEKKQRLRYKSKIEEYGLNYKKISNDDYNEVDKLNIYSWKAFEKYIDMHSKKYWKEESPRKDEGKKPNGFEKNKGKIQIILENNPELREKRRRNHLKKMKGNMFGFKTGEYAQNFPLYCNNCYASDKCILYVEPKENETIVCGMRKEFKNIFPVVGRSRENILEWLDRLQEIKGARLSVAYYFELLDGGLPDKNVSQMLFALEEGLRLKDYVLRPSKNIQINNNTTNIISVISNRINKLPEKDKRRVLDVLDEVLEKNEQKSDTN